MKREIKTLLAFEGMNKRGPRMMVRSMHQAEDILGTPCSSRDPNVQQLFGGGGGMQLCSLISQGNSVLKTEALDTDMTVNSALARPAQDFLVAKAGAKRCPPIYLVTQQSLFLPRPGQEEGGRVRV